MDIFYILFHYEEESVSDRRFDVIVDHNLTYEISGAFLLGKDLRRLVPSFELDLVQSFLSLFSDEYSDEMQQTVMFSNRKESAINDLLKAFEQGLWD